MTKDMRKVLDCEAGDDGQDDGVFYMRWTDFRQCFTRMDVCRVFKLEDNWLHAQRTRVIQRAKCGAAADAKKRYSGEGAPHLSEANPRRCAMPFGT